MVLIGLPSSGKSTFAHELSNSLLTIYPKSIIIDTDQIRYDLFGTEFKAENEPYVVAEKHRQLMVNITPDSAVILDDMHYYVSMRHELYSFAQQNHILYHAIHLTTLLTTCLTWNYNRNPNILPELIIDIANKFNVPGKKYRWDLPFYAFDPEKISMELASQSYLDQLMQILQEQSDYEPVPIQNTFDEDQKMITTEDLCNGENVKEQGQNNELHPLTTVPKRFDKSPTYDTLSRKLIASLLHKDFYSEELLKTAQILSSKFQISLQSSNASQILSVLRRSFLKWLKNNDPNEKENKTIDSLFVDFLNETPQL